MYMMLYKSKQKISLNSNQIFQICFKEICFCRFYNIALLIDEINVNKVCNKRIVIIYVYRLTWNEIKRYTGML